MVILAGTPTGKIIGHVYTILSAGASVAERVILIAFTEVISVGAVALQLAVLHPEGLLLN